jgi:radical SAM protein with 4Fe4S-binding SPASM domain
MKKFKKIYLEITNICNLHCSFCPTSARKPCVMSLESFCKVLDEIEPFTDYVYLHVKGEPLSHPQLHLFLDACHERNLKVNIVTNGTLIQKVTPKILLKPALRQVNFSLHSFEEESEGLHLYLAHILAFTREALSETPIIISYRLWNLNQADHLKPNSGAILAMIETFFGLDYSLDEMLTSTKSLKIADRFYLNLDNEFRWPSMDDADSSDKGFCYALRDQAAILVDGTVVPCCLDGEGVIGLGNVFEQKFSEIITSARAEAIYNGFSHSHAVEALCRKCVYKEKFD